MVAFEQHAQIIINALWESIGKYFDINPDKLTYFKIHVGGDDPAEAYHVAMTKEMISHIVKPLEQRFFIKTAFAGIDSHLAWSQKISAI